MKSFRVLLLCATLQVGTSFAQTTVYTDPVGFVNVTVKAQSDAVLSVPLQRSAVFMGSASAVNTGASTVTLSSAPTLPANTTCALLFASGAKEGMFAKITSLNGAVATVTLNAGDDLTGIVSGDKVTIMPYWTPATLVPSTAPIGLKLMTFDSARVGVNIATTKFYAHAGSGNWLNGMTGASASNDPLEFGSSFVLQNPSNTDLTVSFVGDVPMKKHRAILATLAANTAQDIRFGYSSPVPETLANVGLVGQEGDQLFEFDNSVAGYNRPASQILIYTSGSWNFKVSGLSASAFQLKPGYGYIYRKAATSNPSSYVWSDLPSYVQ